MRQVYTDSLASLLLASPFYHAPRAQDQEKEAKNRSDTRGTTDKERARASIHRISGCRSDNARFIGHFFSLSDLMKLQRFIIDFLNQMVNSSHSCRLCLRMDIMFLFKK